MTASMFSGRTVPSLPRRRLWPTRVFGKSNGLRAVEIRIDGRSYLTRTELIGHAHLAFKALGIR